MVAANGVYGGGCDKGGGVNRYPNPDCNISAQDATSFCAVHGGGKPCQHPGWL
jgi:hypothetical protein